jgi:hypothetical protein
MRILLALLAGCCCLGISIAHADDAPPPKDCIRAYVTLDRVRARERDLNYDSSKEGGRHVNFTGLGRYVPGYGDIDFNARADSLSKKLKDPAGWGDEALGAHFSLSAEAVDAIMMEGNAAAFESVIAPEKVYARQEPLFATARACDIAYGFTPVLPATPSVPEVVTRIKSEMHAGQKQKDDRLAALSDLQCTVRFAGAASLFPAGSPGQQTLQQHYVAGLGKLQPTMRDLPPERVKELLQREMTELGILLQKKAMEPRDLVDEVNYCEIRFGLPVTQITLNNP